MQFNESQMKLLESRYLDFRINGEGKKEITETPEDMFRRVARFLANTQREEDSFFELMNNLIGLPNSPTLWGAGKDKTLKSACAVLEIQDSTEDIMTQLKNAVILQKLSSGVGIYLGNIRAKRSLVSSSGNVALGPVAVLRMYDAVAYEISQGGRRRGAFIGILPVWHEDIMEFIRCKEIVGELPMVNISVAITDKFMAAVQQGKDYQLYSPVNGKRIPTRRTSASAIWDMMIHQAWLNGEPGFFFIDSAQSKYPNVKCTNPCAEALLEHKEFCNLGSINLIKMLDHKPEQKPPYEFNWDRLRWAVKTMVIMLNRVIEKNYYPDEEYRRQVLKNRKVGLGVMGFADMLIFLEMKYASIEALNLGKQIMRYIHEQALRYSHRYNFDNKALTCIAPTGSISTIAGVSSGIEPIFNVAYTRKTYEGYEFKIENVIVGDWVQTAHELAPEQHVRMLGQLAKHVDMGISKTVNFHKSTDPVAISRIVRLAWELGIIGITCYRDGSRADQPLNKCDEEVCHL